MLPSLQALTAPAVWPSGHCLRAETYGVEVMTSLQRLRSMPARAAPTGQPADPPGQPAPRGVKRTAPEALNNRPRGVKHPTCYGRELRQVGTLTGQFARRTRVHRTAPPRRTPPTIDTDGRLPATPEPTRAEEICSKAPVNLFNLSVNPRHLGQMPTR